MYFLKYAFICCTNVVNVLVTLRKNALDSATHKLIKKVTLDIDGMGFNTAIAAMMGYINEVYAHGTLTLDELKVFVRLLCPFAPHICEEIWAQLGEEGFCSLAPWPEYDEAKTIDQTIEIAVQVNGKLRGTVVVAKDIAKDDAIAAAKDVESVVPFLADKTIVKEIYVPGKIVNIVVK